ncbi:MAG TPA: HemK/PrmC family methyltransferase [Candidatus Paceibacterota bacterium]
MEPREYKEGWTEFLNCKINLSKHPFIPRPETEYWVNQFLNSRLDPSGLTRVLDIFTGSGCIGIALITKWPLTEVVLVDKTNYISTSLPANAKFVQSDLFAKVPGGFDVILANPPYVAEGKGMAGIMEHEPANALYAGKDGLSVIKPFLERAPSHLNPNGQIWMEFGPDQKEDVTNLLREFNYYQNFNCSFHKDQHGTWRYLVATRNS